MKQRLDKTNAVRLLEREGVPFEVFTYDPASHSAVEVAGLLGVPAEQVYKTIVIRRDPPAGRPFLVMLPGDREVDLKILARSLSEKALQLAPHREAERLTGLQVGGIGALALVDRGFVSCLDRAALAHQRILVNGGRRGLNLGLGVSDLIRLTGARLVDTGQAGSSQP
jgi:Cys-tRNA(Pro)/Cys-tRNA(Cys) deacylase